MKIIQTDKFFGKGSKEVSFQEYLDTSLTSPTWDEEANSCRNFENLKQSFIKLSELLVEKGIFDIQEFHDKVIKDDLTGFVSFEFKNE